MGGQVMTGRISSAIIKSGRRRSRAPGSIYTKPADAERELGNGTSVADIPTAGALRRRRRYHRRGPRHGHRVATGIAASSSIWAAGTP